MGNSVLPEVASTAEELYKLASKCGINAALKVAFDGNVSVTIKIPKALRNTPIDEFDFDTRVNNILAQWCRIYSDKPKTVDRIVDLVDMGDRAREFIHGYGQTTKDKLRCFLLGESYELLTDAEQREFCVNTIIQNCRFEEFT